MASLNNLLLLLTSLAYVLVRGHARQHIAQPKRICIVQMAQMGDMICTTPMFRAVKEKFPDSKLYIVGKPMNEAVLRGNPDVDHFIAWEKKPFALARQLRALDIEAATLTGPNFVGLAALLLAGVPCIVAPVMERGWSPLETRGYRLLRRFVHTRPHTFNAYGPREYLRLLEVLGIHTQETKKYVYFTQEALASVEQKILESGVGDRPFAIIAPGAGHQVKRWPPERFAALADYIAEQYMPVVVIGGAHDRSDTDGVLTHAQSSDVVNFGEKLSIEELKACISKASFFVSGDTGPLYIAEALRIPTIDILGPVSEHDQPPNYPPKHVVVAPPRGAPAMYLMNAKVYDAAEVRRQASATSVEEVKRVVDTLVIENQIR